MLKQAEDGETLNVEVVLIFQVYKLSYINLYYNYANASTSVLTEQYNPCNNASNKSQAPEDGCINIWNTLSSI